MIEVYGPESSGKTTLTLHAIAEVQKQGGRAAFIDAEHAIDPVYAKNLGVNVDELILSQPDSGEQGLAIAETLVKSDAIDLVVVDSVAALVPQVELDGEMSDNSVGLQARLMSKAMRRLSGLMNKTSCTIIFINQLDSKAGQLFTLIHEFIHVLYGDSDLLESEELSKRNKKEAIINSVTAEILAPKSLIIDLFDEEKNIKDSLEIISKKTEVSKFVALRRLYDLSMISKDSYQSINYELEEEFKQIQKLKKPSNGGNYSNNLRFRIDNNFFKYVNNAVQQNKITYTDAFNIVGVGYKGYKILSKGEG